MVNPGALIAVCALSASTALAQIDLVINGVTVPGGFGPFPGVEDPAPPSNPFLNPPGATAVGSTEPPPVASPGTQFDAGAAIAGGEVGVGSALPGAGNTAAAQLSAESVVLQQQTLLPSALLVRACACAEEKPLVTSDIRGISDTWVSGGNVQSPFPMSNMVWSFGQFVDHDLTLTIEDQGGPVWAVGSNADDMQLHRAVGAPTGGCPISLNAQNAQLDGGNIYGSQDAYLRDTLRAPGSCYMRTSSGNFLPLTTFADERGLFHFLAGDVRVAEHAFLSAQHTLWLREHNRICGVVDADPDFAAWSADDKFNLVRKIVVSKYQRVILEEFLPALGISQSDLQTSPGLMNRPDVAVEFSIAYRLGHDLIGDFVGSFSVADAFNGEAFFLQHGGSPGAPTVTYKPDAESRLANLLSALASSRCNAVDGKLSDALRNLLFGHAEQEDLAGRNIFRGREMRLPTYAGLAQCYGTTADSQIEAETPDAWLGLLREPKAGGRLPPTLRRIVTEQFGRSFFGPGGFFWRAYQQDLGKFLPEVEASNYGQIISANVGTNVGSTVFVS